MPTLWEMINVAVEKAVLRIFKLCDRAVVNVWSSLGAIGVECNLPQRLSSCLRAPPRPFRSMRFECMRGK